MEYSPDKYKTLLEQSERISYLDTPLKEIFSYFLSINETEVSLENIAKAGNKYFGLDNSLSYKALAELEIEGLIKGKRDGNETPKKFRLTFFGKTIKKDIEEKLTDLKIKKK